MADELELLRLLGELIPEPTTDAWARARAAIAAAREEDLRDQVTEQSAGHPQAPTGLTRRATRRRGRRLRWGAAVAAGLAAGAAALVAALMPGAGRNGGAGGQVADAAYVVKRVDGALSAAGPGQIARMTLTTRGAAGPGGTAATTTAKEWSYGDQWRAVRYSPDGHLTYDEGSSTSSGYTLVSYAARTWARQPGLVRPGASASGSPGCGPVIAALPSLFQPPGVPATGLPAGWQLPTGATALRAAVSCGTLTVAGRQRVDGIETLELTSGPGSQIAETIWVSPGTYLPVRVVVRPTAGQQGPWQTADITWLPPTAQNQAKLTVPIPAGFRQVPLAQVGGANLRLTP